ncbi:hypothetical protein VPH35_009168 [Triticum aestivum]
MGGCIKHGLQSTSSLWCGGHRHQRVGNRPRPQWVVKDGEIFWDFSMEKSLAMKDVFPSQVMKMVLIGVGFGLYKLGFPATHDEIQVDKCVEIGFPELILMVAFSQVLQVKLYMQLMELHDRHFNISSWKPLSVSMNNCRWSGARLHCLVGYFLPGVVEEFSEAWFILRMTFSLSFC